MPEDIEIYTDGGCHGNPGPGGWAFVLTVGDFRHEASGGAAVTTNNRMELEAVIRALEHASEAYEPEAPIVVHTDSQYVRNGITSWIHRWVKNGWQTAGKKPVKNRELWQRLLELDKRLQVDWKWVKGHSGNLENERCDSLVQIEIAQRE
jgi:ribonuclease HI